MSEWVLRERFPTDAGEIAWDRLGEGPPVVMVHGTPWSSWTWRRVASRLAERFTVYVFDLLGFGASDRRPGQDVSLAAHGTRLAALLEHWRLDRPAVIAHDIGGAAALRRTCCMAGASLHWRSSTWSRSGRGARRSTDW